MEIVLIITSCAYLMGILVASQSVAWYTALLVIMLGTIFLLERIIIMKNKYLLIIISIILFFTGIINIQRSIKNFEIFRQYDGEKIRIEGMVISEELNDQRYEMKVVLREINGIPVKGNVILYNYLEANNIRYQYGDIINTIATFSYPKPAQHKGAFSFELFYRAKGIVGTASYIPISTEYLGNNIKPYDIFKFGYEVNKKINISNKLFLPHDEAEMLNAIMLGDKSGLSEDLYEDIKLSGVAHVVAVSGLHVSILLLFFMFVMQRFFSRNYILNTIGIFGLLFFYAVVGYTPSMARAVLMSVLALSACYFKRRSEMFTSVAFSAIVIVIFRPFAIFDVSFLLSFAATLAILFFVVPLNGKIRNYVLSVVLLSIFATVGTAYITAYFFNTINFTGIITNVVIIPLATIALIGGYVAAVVPFLMKPLSFALYAVLWLIKTVVTYSAKIPYLNIRVPMPSFEQLLLYLVVLYLVGKGVRRIAEYNKE